MKINLTKEEWLFLNSILGNIIVFRDDDSEETLKKVTCSREIYEKLGSKWVDDEIIP